jgi:hypothetical protein
MRGHDEHRVGAHRKYLAADLDLLGRFPNRCIRFVRVVRRFSAAFVAAKRPLKPLRSKASAALAIFFLPLLRGPVGPHYTNVAFSLACEAMPFRITSVPEARHVPVPCALVSADGTNPCEMRTLRSIPLRSSCINP